MFLIRVLLSISPFRYFSGKEPRYWFSKFFTNAYKNRLLTLYTFCPALCAAAVVLEKVLDSYRSPSEVFPLTPLEHSFKWVSVLEA